MKLGPVDYLSLVAPPGYRCACGACGVKLWRPVHGSKTLSCAECAEKEGGLAPGSVDDSGRYADRDIGRTDQVAGLLPCVPTPEGDTSWGYSSVPTAGVAWWRALPTYDPAEPHESRLRRMVGEYAGSAETWERCYKSDREMSNAAFHRAFALASLARDIVGLLRSVTHDLRSLAEAPPRPEFAREVAADALAKVRCLMREAAPLVDDPREARNDELVQLRADAVCLDNDADQMARALDKIRAAADAGNRGWLAKVTEALSASKGATERAKERRGSYDFQRPGAELLRELKEILECLREKPEPYLAQADRLLAAVLTKGDRS